eukprot:s689_g54.t1
MNKETRCFWIDAIRKKHVIGFLGGPPCESWSCAREQGHAEEADSETSAAQPQRGQPRPIRTLEELWGMECVTLRELAQLFFGNVLLCFALQAVMELIIANGFAVLEHPAEPLHRPSAASIWRLPLLRVLTEIPGVDVVSFAQGLMGAASAKPTMLLTVNMPTLLTILHAFRVRTEVPIAASIGKDLCGRWRTSALKEYPPSLCKGLAYSFFSAIKATPIDGSSREFTAEELNRYRAMVVSDFGSVVGRDYAPH